jgi:hypothetical protein
MAEQTTTVYREGERLFVRDFSMPVDTPCTFQSLVEGNPDFATVLVYGRQRRVPLSALRRAPSPL